MIIDQVLDYNGKVIETEAFHPGIFLQEEIEERGLVKKEVAKVLDILPNHLSDIFAGKRNISAKMALKLEKLFEISAQYWLGIQMEYDLYIAKEREELV